MIVVALLLAATGTETLNAMIKAAITCPSPGQSEIAVCGRRNDSGERSRYLSAIPQ